jgi:hypothetical protein
VEQHSFGFLYFLFHLFFWEWIARGSNPQQKFNLNSIPLSLRITLFVTALQRKGIKPRNPYDHGDHLAPISN